MASDEEAGTGKAQSGNKLCEMLREEGLNAERKNTEHAYFRRQRMSAQQAQR